MFVSHLHPDHCADLSCLRHAILSANRLGRELRLPVFVPNDPPEKFEVLAGFEDAFEVHTISTDSRSLWRLQVSGVKFSGPVTQFLRTVLLCRGGNQVLYTSDTGWKAELVNISRGADILLCEGSLLTADSHLAGKGHLTGEQAGVLALEAGVGMLVLTLLARLCSAGFATGGFLCFPGKFELAGEFRAYIKIEITGRQSVVTQS